MNMTRKEEFMQAVARGWCHEKTSGKTMDTDLAMAITEELLKLKIPNLGCATTGALIDEVKARIDLDGKLEYRTIDN